MKTITDKQKGLLPLPKEISLRFSCPDWVDMCKHVAAVLYGVGARLDQEPELLFKLRHEDHLELINKAALKTPAKRGAKAKVIADKDLSNLFGIEIAATSDIKSTKEAKPKTSLGRGGIHRKVGKNKKHRINGAAPSKGKRP